MDGLNPRQRRFVEEYLVDLNGTQAALRAGYSPKTATAQGSRLLSHADVQAAITRAMERRAQRTEVTIDRVVLELARIAFSDIRGAIEWDDDGNVRILPSAELPPEVAAVLKKVEQTEFTQHWGDKGSSTTVKRKVELLDKLKALELLGRHLGMFTDRQQMDVTLQVIERRTPMLSAADVIEAER